MSLPRSGSTTLMRPLTTTPDAVPSSLWMIAIPLPLESWTRLLEPAGARNSIAAEADAAAAKVSPTTTAVDARSCRTAMP